MTNFKKLTIWTIILNLFIVVAAGHGIGCLGLIEIFWFPQFYGIGTEDFSFSLASSFDKTIGLVALLSLIGQVLLVSTLFVKGHLQIFWTQVLGLFLLWTGFFYLAHSFFTDNISQISVVTGLPFLIVSFALAYKTVRQKMHKS